MGKVIVFFIQQHYASLVIFCRYETNLMFPNPNETQFTTNFLMVEWLFKLSLLLFSKLLWIHNRQPLSTHGMAPIITSPSPRLDMFEPI
jgi:hypothetical protein